MALQELEALRSALVQHQASAAREQDLRLAAWRSELSSELARQAAALAESFSSAHGAQQKQTEARLEALLAARVQDGLDGFRGDVAAIRGEQRALTARHSELRSLQNGYETTIRADLDKIRLDLGQLGESVRLTATSLASMGQETVTWSILEAHVDTSRSEAARALSGLEGALESRLGQLREEAGPARLAELEQRLRLRVEGAQRETQAQLAAAESRLAESLELTSRSELKANSEASRRETQGQIGSVERRLVEQTEVFVARRCDELRVALERELAAALQRQQLQFRKVLTGAFRGHAAELMNELMAVPSS